MTQAIYPRVEIRTRKEYDDFFHVKISTRLRKQNPKDGKWYLIDIVEHQKCWDQDVTALSSSLIKFYETVYINMIAGVIDTKLLDIEGQPIHKEDPNQISEVDRVMEMLSR